MSLNPFTQSDQLYGAARVASDGTSDGTTDTNSYREGRITATALSTTGVYTVTLDPGLDGAEALIGHRLVNGAANGNVQTNQSSDTLIVVSTYVGTVLTSAGFEVSVRKVRSAT